MKTLLISLGAIALATTTAPAIAKNISVTETNQAKHQIRVTLKNTNQDKVRAVYQPNSPRASFHYLDITKRVINKNLTTSQITLNKINFDHRQTEIHTKNFDQLATENKIVTLGDPSYWNDQTFADNTSVVYVDTIMEGVTKYKAQLSVGLTKDNATGKIFLVWGVYGEVVLGSNQATVSSQVKSVVIKY